MTMKKTLVGLVFAVGLVVATTAAPASAQALKTTSRILYHNGPVMQGTSAVYLIWYGCWASGCVPGGQESYAPVIVTDFVSNLGSSSYFMINSEYPDASGAAPSGGLIYAGSVREAYSRGPTLTQADVAGIVTDQLTSGGLPADAAGIYVVLTSADVTVVDGDTQFCVTCCELHGASTFAGVSIKYAFVGNPRRCPSSCGSAVAGGRAPNDNPDGDAMVSWLAHALNGIVTNPLVTNGWFDRYGLENSQKCEGLYGDTYPAQGGGVANVRLGQRDYLLQQNWVNGRKGRCSLSRF
jgi:Phosphate-induced protein 1 conserved region